MNLSSHLVQRVQKLPPPVTRELVVECDLAVPMRDGAGAAGRSLVPEIRW